MTDTITLHAPLSGWLSSLDDVPDEVFAGRMMGDGFAIDPLSAELLAPCDATVVQVAATSHAVTLRTRLGAEVLLHIGLETVALAGQGFEAHVAAGDRVSRGQTLLSFDIDFVAQSARSLVTPVVITNPDEFELVLEPAGRAVGEGVPVAGLRRIAAPGAGAAQAEGETHCIGVDIALPHGFHARPAARIAAAAKAQSLPIVLRANGREANGRSPVAIMSLGVKQGDRVEISAQGNGAAAAVAGIAELIRGGMEEAQRGGTPGAAPLASLAAEGEMVGVCAVPGLAVGPAAQLRLEEQEVREEGSGVASEAAALDDAIARLRADLLQAADGAASTQAGIAAAHLALLEDEELLAAARAEMARGKSAAFAWRSALLASAETLLATGNPLLQERVADLADLERQLISRLEGGASPGLADVPEGAILLARDLLPSQLMGLPKGRLAGLCTAAGGPTSHVAIIAAALGLPTVVAAGEAILSVADGATVVLDATAGRLIADPEPALIEQARSRLAASLARSAANADPMSECRTADGTKVDLFANLGSAAEAAAAVAAGAEGCGLLRTEFLFLDRREAPSEEEQRSAYQEIADALGGRPLVVRTLDVGGDKQLPYLAIPHEENPALGLRGVRTSLWRPDLLDEQLRAILRVRPPGRCRIMVPMVASVAELRAVRSRAETLAAQLGTAGELRLGVMVETPAAAMLTDRLAADADFFSIGTNDLTQYALAVDRGNPLLASQVDAFHPAVLRLIAATVNGAGERPVGVCGGLASDPLGALVLIGLGIRQLSVAPPVVGALKGRIGSVTIAACRAAAEAALTAESPGDARRAAASKLEEV